MLVMDVTFYFITTLCIVNGAKILGIFPHACYSQAILARTLMRELASRGHQVTVISPFPQNDTIENYRDISTAGLVEIRKGYDLFDLENLGVFKNILNIYDIGYVNTDYTLKQKEVQELIQSDQKFDLVLAEQFFNEAHMGFAYHFKAPLVLFSSVGASERSNHLVGNPSPLSVFPNTFIGYSGRMSFWHRFQNTFVGLFDILYRELYVLPSQNQILQKYFPGAPHLHNLMYNASLLLLNSHVSVNDAVVHGPNMVEIGGFHVKLKKLPLDLQQFLDEAHHGAIYFSMGSNLKGVNLSPEKQAAMVNVFSKLKQKVLWKWENESMPGKPSNVKLRKWLPQQDILAHPNIKLFISHGGLASTTETIYFGVPVIGIPIFGDQRMNIARAVDNGYAISIPFQEVNENRLFVAVEEILSNPKYGENARRRSKIMRDQPIQPLDSAMFWIEYVLRNRGAVHLQSTALNLTWYQYYLLDVVSCLFGIIVGIFVLSYVCFKTLNNCCTNNVAKKSKMH